MGHVVAILNQQAFRARNDDGSESGASWLAALNTNWTQDVDATFRVRFLIQETAGAGAAVDGIVEYNLNGAGWNAVTASTPVQFTASGTVADATATTQQLGAGTFVAGEFDQDGTITTAPDLAGNDETEFEYCLTIDSAQVVDADSLELRVSAGGSALDVYTTSPTITVNEAAAPVTLTQTSTVSTALQKDAAIAHSLAAALQVAQVRAAQVSGALAVRSTTDHSVTSALQKVSELTPLLSLALADRFAPVTGVAGLMLKQLSRATSLTGNIQNPRPEAVGGIGRFAIGRTALAAGTASLVVSETAYTVTTSVTAVMTKAFTSSSSVSGSLSKSLVETITLRAALEKTQLLAASLRGTLQTPYTQQTALSLALQEAFKPSTTLSTALQFSEQQTLTARVVLQKSQTRPADITGLLVRAATIATTLTGNLVAEGSYTVGASVSLALQIPVSHTTTLSGSLQNESVLRLATLAGVLGVKQLKAAALSAGLAIAQSAGVGLRGLVGRVIGASLGLSGNLQASGATYLRTGSLGGALARASELSLAASGTLLKPTSLASSVSGALATGREVTIPTTLDIIAFDTFLPVATVSGTLLQKRGGVFTAGAALMRVSTEDMTIAGRLVYRYFLTPSLVGTLAARGLNNLGISAYLKHVIACYVEPQGGEKSTVYSTESGKSSVWDGEEDSLTDWSKEEVAPNGC